MDNKTLLLGAYGAALRHIDACELSREPKSVNINKTIWCEAIPRIQEISNATKQKINTCVLTPYEGYSIPLNIKGYSTDKPLTIFKIQVELQAYWSSVDDSCKWYTLKATKAKLLNEIFRSVGLGPYNMHDCDWGDYYWQGVAGKFTTYGAQYGDIVTEITLQEYLDGKQLYFNKINNNDVEILNKILAINNIKDE